MGEQGPWNVVMTGVLIGIGIPVGQLITHFVAGVAIGFIEGVGGG